MTQKYNNTQEDLNHIFNYLKDHRYFEHEELLLVIKGWGDNINTYDTICQVRFAMDFDQLEESEEE